MTVEEERWLRSGWMTTVKGRWLRSGWRTTARLEVLEVVLDLGAGPVLGTDEFAAEVSVAVDDVGFGDLGGAVKGVDALFGVADGEEVDVVLGKEAAVDVVVLVDADTDDGELRHLMLEGEEAGKFFDAGGAPGGPEIEDDDAAAELGEVEGLDAVGDFEEGGGVAEVFRVGAAVTAGCGEEESEGDCGVEEGGGSTHGELRFL